jgi:hypothetical protein
MNKEEAILAKLNDLSRTYESMVILMEANPENSIFVYKSVDYRKAAAVTYKACKEDIDKLINLVKDK